jgi:hypothetical protein
MGGRNAVVREPVRRAIPSVFLVPDGIQR